MDAVVAAPDAHSIPLDKIDVSDPALFREDRIGAYFARLRREDPVHYCAESRWGPYWSITRFDDIMQVDTNHTVFSSDSKYGGVSLEDRARRNFISMDPPRHDEQRRAISPIVAQPNLRNFEILIRERTADVLDTLPVRTEFDWVSKVSIDLTTKMLATLFGFPYEDRSLLTQWSDISVVTPFETDAARSEALQPCFAYFTRLLEQRLQEPPKADLISMLAHSDGTRSMERAEFYGNILLLIVGGNDTTRNTMSASVLALHENPNEFDKLRNRPELIPSMVSETIRWQTPLTHMRRTAVADVEMRGKRIRRGDKVAMWYLSGNFDEEAIENADRYIIDRPNVRRHLSFGFGVHRCVGNRLAELQLRILWEEMFKRKMRVEVVGAPVRTNSNVVHGFESLPVRVVQ